ncbi:hypothetical protein BP5796_12188 [Coleophoma crateriformis]|uniref:Uncharacterized protein n=1 Tax=Coleophoma crateriformis TaxID=565419 RepID=A0A3D8QCX4_9HELO|nr:hypothetical protein BP5796_12188 [Coleophoma crateriformis]
MIQNWRVQNKQEELDKLRKEIKDITDARLAMVKLGSTSLEIFNNNINILSSTWQLAQNDAIKIKASLTEGTKDITQAEIFVGEMGTATGFYKSMAAYLSQYADGIQSGSIPNSAPPVYK